MNEERRGREEGRVDGSQGKREREKRSNQGKKKRGMERGRDER